MFKHIKLTSVSGLLALLLTILCGSLALAQFFLSRHIDLIDTTWHLYQTDRSEKARLESSLRAAIGYGGMVHNFKNYILRHDDGYHEAVRNDIGAARAILTQFSALGPSTAEQMALDDITDVLRQYDEHLHTAREMINAQTPITEIDNVVKVDDGPAIRGLQTLVQVVKKDQGVMSQLSKGRLVADIRAAIGYGGFIHDFKNFLLRHDPQTHNQADIKLHKAEQYIAAYRSLSINRAEQIALDDIANALQKYDINLHRIQELIDRKLTISEVDRLVRVDDNPILRALHSLDREIALQVAKHSTDVNVALDTLIRTLTWGTTFMILVLLGLAIFAYWLMQARVIQPMLSLTESMTQLAKNKLDVDVSGHYSDNELGQMTKAVRIFKKNMLERLEVEEKLSSANEAMNEQLLNIHSLREQSEKQTTKALALAEGLAAARESAEWAELHAKEEEQKVSAILNSVRDAIITSDGAGTIETFNPGAEEIFGFKAHEVIGKNIALLMPEDTREQHDKFMKRFADGFATRDINSTVEQTALRRSGETFPTEINLSTTHIGGELKIMAVMRDITERKRAEEEIHRMAMTDSLTGLANRNQFNSRFKESIAQANRYKQNMILMLIDLDKFKPVNDTYGHPVGDALLQHVAHTMVHCFREVDSCARLGGDEFAVILNGVENTGEVEIPAQRFINMVSQPVVIEGHTITIGASIGISSYPSCSTDIDELFKQADEALYRAKESGRNTFRTCKTFATV